MIIKNKSMPENELNIGGKKIGESTKITTNLKTLLWICGILFSVLIASFTFFYVDLKNKISSMDEQFKTTLKQELEKAKNEDYEIKQNIWEIKGDIKVIIDRTSRGSYSQPENEGSRIGENRPPTIAPPDVMD